MNDDGEKTYPEEQLDQANDRRHAAGIQFFTDQLASSPPEDSGQAARDARDLSQRILAEAEKLQKLLFRLGNSAKEAGEK